MGDQEVALRSPERRCSGPHGGGFQPVIAKQPVGGVTSNGVPAFKILLG